ncbi:MAG: YraN family protein [Ignavibacteriae bacterium]|nr:YraN family protein [Ignavibacteriota bacterium]
MEDKNDLARLGEQAAEALLRAQGFAILERNYRFGHGEIDIVARDGNTTVFIEVKTRRNDAFGRPESAVTPNKQRQLGRIATGWLCDNGWPDTPCRFDVVAVTFERGAPVCHHIINAFSLSP